MHVNIILSSYQAKVLDGQCDTTETSPPLSFGFWIALKFRADENSTTATTVEQIILTSALHNAVPDNETRTPLAWRHTCMHKKIKHRPV